MTFAWMAHIFSCLRCKKKNPALFREAMKSLTDVLSRCVWH